MPANQIVGLLPGELFVHRNVGNVVVHSDLNCLSVMQFSVDVLKVRHIIVCGHYGCGGVMAALRRDRLGLCDNWIRHIQDVCQKHESILSGIGDPIAAGDRLCELNVIEQVLNVCQTTIVRDAWERGQELAVLWLGLFDCRWAIARLEEDDHLRVAGNGRDLPDRDRGDDASSLMPKIFCLEDRA